MVDTTPQRIHNVFSCLASFPLNATQGAQRLILKPIYHQTTTSYVVNFALIKLRFLQQHIKSLLSSFYTAYISGILRTPLRHARRLLFRKPYDTYPSPSAEQQYWDSAERGLRQLRLSDARFVGSERPKNVRVPEMPPLVMYYVPALLPQYRDLDERGSRKSFLLSRGVKD